MRAAHCFRALPAAAIAGRRLRTHYHGRNAAPGYHCAAKDVVEGRGVYCLNVGGVQIDDAVVAAFLEALEPARLAATLAAAKRLENDREAALKQGGSMSSVPPSPSTAPSAAIAPSTPTIAWSPAGSSRSGRRPCVPSGRPRPNWCGARWSVRACCRPRRRENLIALGADLASVWQAPTTTARDRKELLRTLIEEVTISVDRDKAAAQLVLRWKGDATSRLTVAMPRSRPAMVRTDEDTLALLRRLAPHYPDAVIAGIVNRQGRRTAYATGSTPTASAICAATGRSPSARPSRQPATATSSPSVRPPPRSVWRRRRFTATSMTASSRANR
ncbi:MAG: hypothetical protein EOS63_20510 [Mesorhizobium sp.]|uniref:hypothetical protein n=1 Tax=Mesorhizobium sp. TaxID=1871066 RepID=UPI000FE8EA8C|nr:hypothetical protein [Mesorhizobium sp.]RWE76937.1 MAG: hypothetical protein EOS63_20510 [Mesorhizobium sp.]